MEAGRLTGRVEALSDSGRSGAMNYTTVWCGCIALCLVAPTPARAQARGVTLDDITKHETEDGEWVLERRPRPDRGLGATP